MTGDEGQIKAKREAAARARRLSAQLSLPADRDRLLVFAAELEDQANVLERGQSAPPPQVTQMQMQVQQGPPSEKDAEMEKKDRDPN